MTIRRIFSCHPWGAFGFDPVPQVARWKHLAGFPYARRDAIIHAKAIDGAVVLKDGRCLAEGTHPGEAVAAAERGSCGAANAECVYCKSGVTREVVSELEAAGVSRLVLAMGGSGEEGESETSPAPTELEVARSGGRLEVVRESFNEQAGREKHSN